MRNLEKGKKGRHGMQTLVEWSHDTNIRMEEANYADRKNLIHELVKLAPGYKDQETEIFYRFVGKMD